MYKKDWYCKKYLYNTKCILQIKNGSQKKGRELCKKITLSGLNLSQRALKLL